MAAPRILHAIYGDELARALVAHAPDADVLVVREALRDGPLATGSGAADLDAFVELRAAHLVDHHGADGSRVRDELAESWQRIATADGDVVLHVDERECVDCAAFLACALDLLHRAGRGIARSRTGVAIARGGDPATAVELRAADLAAAAGAWRMLVVGDAAGLQLAAHDGPDGPVADLPSLLAVRARGDVALEEVHPR
jgi:hypothetical protein